MSGSFPTSATDLTSCASLPGRWLISGAPKTTAAGDLDVVAAESKWPSIVEELRTQRSAHPRGTGGQLQRMGRPGIDPRHGPAGGRACPWFDEARGICWFLGFTPDDDYRMLEARAARGELLPTEDDEVGVTVVLVDASRLADLFLVVRLPLRPEGEPSPPDWPGGELAERLLGICTECDSPAWDAPATVPDVGGTMRPVDPAEEIAMQLPAGGCDCRERQRRRNASPGAQPVTPSTPGGTGNRAAPEPLLAHARLAATQPGSAGRLGAAVGVRA